MIVKPKSEWLALWQRTHARVFKRAAAVRVRNSTPIARPAKRYEVLCDPELKS